MIAVAMCVTLGCLSISLSIGFAANQIAEAIKRRGDIDEN